MTHKTEQTIINVITLEKFCIPYMERREFCKLANLERTGIQKLLSGKAKYSQGFMRIEDYLQCPLLENKELNISDRAAPSGIAFAKRHGMSNGINNLIKGRISTYKGWVMSD